jgi:ribulose-5-phosphate 4-epimerase/fuculose-1-phosphate aldolase
LPLRGLKQNLNQPRRLGVAPNPRYCQAIKPDRSNKMNPQNTIKTLSHNMDHWQERLDLAASFRWAARLNLHEAVANHFSLSVSEDGAQFLMNPNQVHFSRIRASDLLLLDANDPETLNRPGAPDPTAWGLHGSLHRACGFIRCAMHVHSPFATVLASLADSRLPPIDQNTAIFFDRIAIDQEFGGLAFESEGIRCAGLMADPKKKTLIMGNHGVMVTGDSVADTFNRLYYFERAAETYIRALQTGQPLRVMSDELAEKTAVEIETYPEQAERHLGELKAILDAEGSDYAD